MFPLSYRPPLAVVWPAPRYAPTIRNNRRERKERRAQRFLASSASSAVFSSSPSVRRAIDDPPRVPDVMQAGDDRNRQGDPDADVDDHRVIAEIVEQHRRDRRDDV